MTGSPNSETTTQGTVTRLLTDFENGDRSALEAIFPIVYDELRLIAHRQRARWNGDTTMGTTALVNEAYLKLVDGEKVSTRTRAHFLKVASIAMRQILTNYARDRRAAKRGGGSEPLPLDLLDAASGSNALPDAQTELLSDIDEALNRLQKIDSRLESVVECRFFGGLSIEDTAQALGISPATVKRDWSLARAWLYKELDPA